MAGGGWVLYGCPGVVNDLEEEWTKLAQLSFPLERGATVTAAELESCLWAMSYMLSRLHGTSVATSNLQNWRPLDTSKLRILSIADLLR